MTHVVVGGGVVVGAALAGALYYLYRQRQQDQWKDELYDTLRDLNRTVDRHPVNNPQLVENKLSAAEQRLQQGDYRAAAGILDDVQNIILLS